MSLPGAHTHTQTRTQTSRAARVHTQAPHTRPHAHHRHTHTYHTRTRLRRRGPGQTRGARERRTRSVLAPARRETACGVPAVFLHGGTVKFAAAIVFKAVVNILVLVISGFCFTTIQNSFVRPTTWRYPWASEMADAARPTHRPHARTPHTRVRTQLSKTRI